MIGPIEALFISGIFWVLPIPLGVYFAMDKGRSGWYGAAWCFFLSWIGFCIILLSPASVEVRVRREHEEKMRLRALTRDDRELD